MRTVIVITMRDSTNSLVRHGKNVMRDMVDKSEKEQAIKSILNKPSISKKILDHQFKSMRKNVELSGLICNDKFFALDGESRENKIKTVITKDEVKRACKGDPNATWFHTHGTFPKRPSIIDERSNDMIFNEMQPISKSCIVGADGIQCNGDDGKVSWFQWGDPFYDRVNDTKWTRMIRGDKVFCDRTKKGEYQCESQTESGIIEPIGVFKSVASEGLMKMNDDELAFFTDSREKVIECLASKSNDGTRSLSCSPRLRDMIVPTKNTFY